VRKKKGRSTTLHKKQRRAVRERNDNTGKEGLQVDPVTEEIGKVFNHGFLEGDVSAILKKRQQRRRKRV